MSAASSTSGGQVNLSRISVAAAIILLVILVTKSGVESTLVCSSRASIRGITLWVSDLPEPTPKPPISMATSVLVWILWGNPESDPVWDKHR